MGGWTRIAVHIACLLGPLSKRPHLAVTWENASDPNTPSLASLHPKMLSSVAVSVAEPESLAVPLGDDVSDAVPVTVPDCELVGDPLAVTDAVGLAERLAVDVADGVTEILGVPRTDAPTLNVIDGVALDVEDKLAVLDAHCVLDGVGEGVVALVLDPVGDEELVGVPDALVVDVLELVALSLPVLDGEAPFVTDAVGVRESDDDREDVVDGVLGGEDVADDVIELVGVGLWEIGGDVDGVALVLGVFDALAPSVTEDVGVDEMEAESVSVEEGVMLDDPVVDPYAISLPRAVYSPRTHAHAFACSADWKERPLARST